MHRGSFDEDTTLGRIVTATGTDQDEVARSTARDMADFFTEMGVAPAIAERSLKTPPHRMDWLQAHEARGARLFNAETTDPALSEALRAALARAGQEQRQEQRQGRQQQDQTRPPAR